MRCFELHLVWWSSGGLTGSLHCKDVAGVVQLASRDVDIASLPDVFPSTAEPPVKQSKLLAFPLLHNLQIRRLSWFSNFPGLNNLNSGCNVGRSGPFGGLPHLVRQVSPFEGTVSDSVCLRNVDLMAKLVPISSEAVFSPSLGTFSTNSYWAFVTMGG